MSSNLDNKSALVKVVADELSEAQLLLVGEMGPLSSQLCERGIWRSKACGFSPKRANQLCKGTNYLLESMYQPSLQTSWNQIQKWLEGGGEREQGRKERMGDSELLEKQLRLHLLITRVSVKWQNIYSRSFVNPTSAYVKGL